MPSLSISPMPSLMFSTRNRYPSSCRCSSIPPETKSPARAAGSGEKRMIRTPKSGPSLTTLHEQRTCSYSPSDDRGLHRTSADCDPPPRNARISARPESPAIVIWMSRSASAPSSAFPSIPRMRRRCPLEQVTRLSGATTSTPSSSVSSMAVSAVRLSNAGRCSYIGRAHLPLS